MYGAVAKQTPPKQMDSAAGSSDTDFLLDGEFAPPSLLGGAFFCDDQRAHIPGFCIVADQSKPSCLCGVRSSVVRGMRAIACGCTGPNPRDAGDRYEQHSTLNDSACDDQWFVFHFRRDVSSVQHIKCLPRWGGEIR